MCFIIDNNHPREKIAKRDIVCYKTFHDPIKNGFKSFWKEFHYEFNYLYENDTPLVSYDNFNEYIQVGLHSYSTFKTAEGPYEKYIVKCYIPKGTSYYYNEWNNTYVSAAIVIEKEIYMYYQEATYKKLNKREIYAIFEEPFK